jgi:hypothetical protein
LEVTAPYETVFGVIVGEAEATCHYVGIEADQCCGVESRYVSAYDKIGSSRVRCEAKACDVRGEVWRWGMTGVDLKDFS